MFIHLLAAHMDAHTWSKHFNWKLFRVKGCTKI